MERVPIKTNPKLFDLVVSYIQQGLADNLQWLDYAFGIAERLVKEINGKKYYTPNIYIGKNEYELLLPDSGLGNFCFFVLDEPERTSWYAGENTEIETPFSLIMWVDMRTIDDSDERNTEMVKQQILHVLNGHLWLKEGHISINRIWNKAESVFKGFIRIVFPYQRSRNDRC